MAEPIKVLIADEMSKKAVEVLSKAGFTVEVKTGMKPEELAAVIGEYHAIGIRSASKITAATLASPGKLKIIGRAGVGVDNIDVKAATEKGVLVINTPQGNAAAAAELAVGLKMNVIGYDPFPPKELPAGVKQVTLDELIAASDYITLHVPATAETKGLFNGATIAKMKKGACLINCARGGIVDENAVLEALKSGQLGGAALDVFSKEPPDPSPLFAEENLIAVPHLGASTKEAQEKVAIEMAEVFVGFLKDGVVRNAVK